MMTFANMRLRNRGAANAGGRKAKGNCREKPETAARISALRRAKTRQSEANVIFRPRSAAFLARNSESGESPAPAVRGNGFDCGLSGMTAI